jgi:hypothetical protein
MVGVTLPRQPATFVTGKALQQYLERYAEPEAHLADRMAGSFGHALVIPAYDEGDDLLRALQSVPSGKEGAVLVVLVVNAPPEAAAWVHERNLEVLPRIRQKFGREEAAFLDGAAPAHLFRFPAGRILHVDRASPEHLLPKGQGVGLARKIGFDIALRLYRSSRLASAWLHSTDADVLLPWDYFDRASDLHRNHAAALVYPFTHRGEEDIALARAIQLYEISLRYYVLGLASAGSPYAHHTIGSTVAIGATAYAKVRGVPKRTAAEDFYLLGKVAKIGTVTALGGLPISLSGRVSRRVPFGTGPAVERIARGGQFTLYHPLIFAHLGVWLSVLADLSLELTPSGFNQQILERCRQRGLDPAHLIEMAALASTQTALASARRHAKTRDKLVEHVTTWFDAFRTLKFVHTLEARAFPPLSWFEALRAAPFAKSVVDGLHAKKSLDGLALARINESLAALERHRQART